MNITCTLKWNDMGTKLFSFKINLPIPLYALSYLFGVKSYYITVRPEVCMVKKDSSQGLPGCDTV